MNRERHKKFLAQNGKKQLKIDADIDSVNKWQQIKKENGVNSSELLNILVEKGKKIMKAESVLKEMQKAIEEDQFLNYGDLYIEEIDVTAYYMPDNDVWVFDAPWGSGWYYIQDVNLPWEEIEPVWFRKRF